CLADVLDSIRHLFLFNATMDMLAIGCLATVTFLLTFADVLVRAYEVKSKADWQVTRFWLEWRTNSCEFSGLPANRPCSSPHMREPKRQQMSAKMRQKSKTVSPPGLPYCHK